VYVTHDQVEAMTMGDRVAVMRKGELQQVASPQELYDRPVNLFVGGFIGSPAMNMLDASLERSNGGMVAKLGSQELELGEHVASDRPALARYAGRRVVLGIRPEDLNDAEHAPERAEAGTLKGEVSLTEALGSEIMVHLGLDAKAAFTEDVRELARDVGAPDAEGQPSDSAATVVGRFDPRSTVRPGQPATIAVDTRQLHFFDPESGAGIYDQTS
jgi:multiple sugar transport system ATP-binding protein